MTNILIVGANGFIGSNITRGLINKNYKVSTITKNNSNNWRLKDLKNSYKNYFADITNYKKLHDAVFNLQPDYVINCAAYGVYPTENDSEKIIKNNINGTKNLIDAIKDYHKIKKIINIGSYLELLKLRKSDGKNWEDYANAKSKQTELMHEFGHKSGIPVSTLRLFNPYGNYESPGRLVCDIMIAMVKKEKLEIFSKTSEHNFYHINDVIESVTKLIIDSQTNDKIFNLQTPNGISVESMVNTAIKIADSKIEITWKDENHRDTQVEYQEKNANDHIISPITSLEDGLSETFVWYKKNISLYNQFGV